MASTKNKQILIIGVTSGPDPTPGAGHWSAEKILEAVKAGIEQAKQAGFDSTIYSVDTKKSDDVVIAEARAVFQSQHWDGVNIGFGVRGTESLTPLFERLVNAVVEDVKPPPKFIFALRPHLVWEAISRVFGIEQTK